MDELLNSADYAHKYLGDEDNEPEDDMFPASFDITLHVERALKEGITTPDMAQAIYDAFKGLDPIRVEYLADALQEMANNAQKLAMKKHNESRQ